jgi:hypothetical protein
LALSAAWTLDEPLTKPAGVDSHRVGI